MQHWHPLSWSILRIPNRFSASWEWSHPTSSSYIFLFDTESFMFVYNLFFSELPCSFSPSNFRAMEHTTVTPEKIEESLITIFSARFFSFYLFLGLLYNNTLKKNWVVADVPKNGCLSLPSAFKVCNARQTQRCSPGRVKRSGFLGLSLVVLRKIP